METDRLIAHPDHPPQTVSAVAARITGLTPDWLVLRWRIENSAEIMIPAFTGSRRADGLWRTTCFELFVQPAGGAEYAEINLSPGEDWAAYDFTGYRAGMAARAMARAPVCTLRRGSNRLIFDAAVPLAGLPPRPWRAGLTAVIEEAGGVKSWWAAAHRAGPPDFHDPACLTLAIPAATRR